MKHHVREVQKEAQDLKNNGEIDDFIIGHGTRHLMVNFKFRGAWFQTPFPSSPRTPYTSTFVRQQIRRRIRMLQRPID